MFKDMGVDAVHLAEFHGDGHPRDPGDGPLERSWRRCSTSAGGSPTTRSCSSPARRPTSTSASNAPGAEPGHWLYLFPRPVYWTMNRGKRAEPFDEKIEGYGKVYHVGDRDEMLRLLKEERRPRLDGPRADQVVELGARRLPR